MRKCYSEFLPELLFRQQSVLFWLCIVFISTPFKAQNQQYIIQDSLIKKYISNNPDSVQNTFYYLIRFKDKSCLDKLTTQIIRDINSKTAIIKITDYPIQLLSDGNCIELITMPNDLWKFSGQLEAEAPLLLKNKHHVKQFIIMATNVDSLITSLREKEISFKLLTINRESNAAVIECQSRIFFTFCIPDRELIFADLFRQPVSDLVVSGYNRYINNLSLSDLHFPDADGNGITIGIKERMPDVNDIDLQKRILPSVLASAETDYHASVSATLAGGAGNSFITGKGVASRSLLFPSSFNNLFPDSSALLKQKNVSVQNHAYGTIIQPFYGAEALSYDLQTWQHKNLVHVFSSGNKGTSSATSGIYAGITGFANLTGNFKMSKNVITVAAADTGNKLAPFSSSGPLFDGRLGPQITALGPNGTSEAAAIVSGAVAVLQQVYKDINAGQIAPSSLIKALMYNTAEDIGAKGIDYKSGFGLLNLYAALNSLKKGTYFGGMLASSGEWSSTLQVPPMAANLKVTLTWTDTSATVNNYKTLVNDLDLELVNLQSGMVYQPWLLSSFPSADSLNKFPIRRRDSLNTAEQVSIEFPEQGAYLIKVKARNIQTTGPQDFHIAYYWDTLQQFRFVNPVQTSDLDRAENPVIPIKWNVAIIDSNLKGDLSVSFDNSASWNRIGTGINLSQKMFHWNLPDTSTLLRLKMETPFGIFYSEQVILAPVTRINIDYLCNDSVRLSWPKHIYALAYRLSALGDTAFLRTAMQVSDTFVVLNRFSFTETVFAVQPVLSGGLNAARSMAIDIRNQGVSCFYKNLLAEPVGDSIELDLQLSFTEGITRIEFEKNTALAAKIQTINFIQLQPGQNRFKVYDPSPYSGQNHYRAKIFFNNGWVYTYLVSVYHNGKKMLRIYPVPVSRSQIVHYRIKETAGEVTMQITDITGRLIRTLKTSVAGNIDTGTLPEGIYFIVIRNKKGNVIETGKLIIQ